MKAILILAALVLTGCALSPADLREQGTREAFNMRLAPAAAAACVARNAENSGGPITGHVNTSVRNAAVAGNIELVIFAGTHYYVSAEFSPTSAGSNAIAWVSPHLLESVAKRFLTAFDGC
jgi:hypothetical protein